MSGPVYSRRRWLELATAGSACGLIPAWSRVIAGPSPADAPPVVIERPRPVPIERPQPVVIEAPQPAIFVAHGGPDLAVSTTRGPAFRAWGEQLPRARGVLVMTPHVRAEQLTLGALGPGRALFHFPHRFLPDHGELRYDSPDNRALATRVRSILGDRLTAPRSARTGLDHTTWMPLLHLIPDASVPVLELTMPFASPFELYELGRALAPLRREGVMLMASGNLSHNLAMLGQATETAPWALAFDRWVVDRLRAGDIQALLNFRRAAPTASLAHPDSGDHYSVLAFALGAGVGPGRTLDPHFPIEGFSRGSISNRCIELR